LTSELWVGGGKLFTYKYDKNGNRIWADDGNIRYEYDYDKTDLVEQVDRIQTGKPTVTYQYGYDNVGNLIGATESIGGTVRSQTIYEYNDPRYLNTKISQTGTGLATKEVRFTYDAAGLNRIVDRYVNGILGVKTTNAYDGFGRLTGISHVNGLGVNIGSNSYVLDGISPLEVETIDG
jgi:hypothetical protein